MITILGDQRPREASSELGWEIIPNPARQRWRTQNSDFPHRVVLGKFHLAEEKLGVTTR
jgi:hypothetical protein